MMTTVSLQIVGIIEPIIQHADWFFPGGGVITTVNSVACCNRGYAHIIVFLSVLQSKRLLTVTLTINMNFTFNFCSKV